MERKATKHFGSKSQKESRKMSAYSTKEESKGKLVAEIHNSDQVAHLWANKAQTNAKSHTKQFYFEGDTIYSYGKHFPIARLTGINVKTNVGNRDIHYGQFGEKTAYSLREVVLFTTKSYSNTTAKHKCLVNRALSQDPRYTVLYVENVTQGTEKQNLQALLERVKDCIKKAFGKVTKNSLTQYETAKQELDEYNQFREVFFKRQKVKKIEDFHPKNFNYSAWHGLALEKSNEARKIKEKRNATMQARLEAQEKAHKEQRESEKLARPAKRALWLRNETDTYPYNVHAMDQKEELRALGVYGPEFRLTRKGAVVQSSQGAEVPTKAVKALFLKLWDLRETQSPTLASEIEGKEIGSFQIDKLDLGRMEAFPGRVEAYNGGFRAGCHSVKWSEIRALALRAGWIEDFGSEGDKICPVENPD
jgi:hypothetical protein